MSILEISTASISLSAQPVIISCIIFSALAFIVFIFKDSLQYFNSRHNIVTKDDFIVEAVTWNDGKDGIDPAGVPYFGVMEDPVELEMTAEAAEEKSEVCSDEGIRFKNVA